MGVFCVNLGVEVSVGLEGYWVKVFDVVQGKDWMLGCELGGLGEFGVE